ncbi:septal ring lytic transglycosylase RlpA family protein [Edaphobacter albus]|uniref:septal ring lytic transglycosylase RlpA family protein n=1 Tax=Edaphobacter sp. 4G125 TaxID=2763071 RepID=UPI001C999A36|nr:septal ring lytic transglycosylase RlpA family protein [Edaphobacter sp. 4G125]
MKIIPAKLRDAVVSPRRGLVIVTLLSALGITASASDPSVPVKDTVKGPEQQQGKGRHWFQVGVASWYGHYFQGKKTANGESYDMNGLTCAHRSLPLGSWIRVTNLKNRKSVFVRVNDRGPVPENRIVDLSYGAAKAVGISGIAKVKLETLRPGDPEMARQLIAQLQMPVAVGQGI